MLSLNPAGAIEQASQLQSSSAQAALVHISDRQEWERLAAEFRDYDYRQTWTYGMVSAERFHAKIERVAIRRGTELLGLAAVRLKAVPLLGTGIAYVGGGPLTRRGHELDRQALSDCLHALCEEYVQRRGHTLRVLPPLEPAGAHDAVNECFRSHSFVDSPWPPLYRTVIVDVARPLPEIRKTLAQKWRNCLNNSERQNLTVRAGTEPELFEQFQELFDRFTNRKQISVDLGADFYKAVRARLASDEGYLVALAIADGKPVAGQLASLLGDTGVSLLAATGEEGLKNKAAYLLQWHVIVASQQAGMRWYDPGGIDPESNPGVYHFKSGLGGKEIANPGPFQIAATSMRGSITSAVEKTYRWARRFGRS